MPFHILGFRKNWSQNWNRKYIFFQTHGTWIAFAYTSFYIWRRVCFATRSYFFNNVEFPKHTKDERICSKACNSLGLNWKPRMDSQGKTIDTFPINCPSSESYTKGIVDLNVNINHKFDKGRSMVLFSKSRDIHMIFLFPYVH